MLGVSTRRVKALGIASLSKSEVSRICAALDAEVDAFRQRPLLGERHPYAGWTPPCVRRLLTAFLRHAGRRCDVLRG